MDDKLLHFLALTKSDPLAFTMGAYPWGEPGTVLENSTGPEDWARDLMNRVRDGIIDRALAGALALATNRTVVAIALVGLYLSAGFVGPASAQVSAPSALEYAAAGMGRSTMIAPPAINKRFARRLIRSESNLAGVYAPLAAKAREIEAACGSRVISGRRHTRVAGTRRWSLHAQGKAVDITGNSPCIYAHLRDWPGGVSIDYHRVHPPHVHVSYDPQGGREMGVRFVHRGGARRVRYAHR